MIKISGKTNREKEKINDDQGYKNTTFKKMNHCQITYVRLIPHYILQKLIFYSPVTESKKKQIKHTPKNHSQIKLKIMCTETRIISIEFTGISPSDKIAQFKHNYLTIHYNNNKLRFYKTKIKQRKTSKLTFLPVNKQT